ncbi:MAG: COG4315 family predicted lipoprotein [Arthrobacter sp.]
MKKPFGTGLYILVMAAVLTGCGGGGAGTSSPSPAGSTAGGSMGASASASSASPSGPTSGGSSAPASPVPAGAPVLKTASSSAGQIVVDARGISVYVFAKDVKDSGTSTCTGTCSSNWPPLTTASDSPAVVGVTGTVGTIPTPDGRKQVTINGLPVYLFAKDKAPGDILGQGVGGVWSLVSPAGDMVKASSGSGY